MTTNFRSPGAPDPGGAGAEPSRLRVRRQWFWVVFAGSIVAIVVAVALLSNVLNSALPSIDQAMAAAAFLLVAVCAPFVLFVLARRIPAPVFTEATPHRPVWLSPVTVCAVLCVGLTVFGLAAYRLGSEFVVGSARAHLEAVATLKESLVKAWFEDARDDIRIWSASPQFYKVLDDWRSGRVSDPLARQQLLDFLWRLSKTSHYVEIGVRDATTGELLLTTSGDEDSPAVRRLAVSAAQAALPVLEDFHSDADSDHSGSIYLGFFADVQTPSGHRVVMHVGIDPVHELFPLIEQWPGDTGTAESLLMRREGDAMVVLNDSPARHREPPARRFTSGPKHAIGTELAQGARTFMRGDDDRDQPVLAYARPVPGTSWVLVAKVNDSEAFAELNRIALLIASLAGASLLLAAWWWVEHRRHGAVEQQLRLERARQGQRLTELSRRVVSVQEEERRRFASDLHDRTGANLAAIKLNLQSIEKSLQEGRPHDDELLTETGALLTDTVVSIREFCGELRPAILDYAGLTQAIENSVARFGRRTGIASELDHAQFSGRCAPEVESVLFRIVQEALLNCAKHSNAANVRVRLAGHSAHLTLAIEDDGVGFDPDRLGRSGGDTGRGILSMRERAAFAGATFTIESTPGRGTRITVEL